MKETRALRATKCGLWIFLALLPSVAQGQISKVAVLSDDTSPRCLECDIKVNTERPRTIECKESHPGKILRSSFTAKLSIPRIVDAGEVLVSEDLGLNESVVPVRDLFVPDDGWDYLAPYEQECLNLLSQRLWRMNWREVVGTLRDKAVEACLSAEPIRCQADAACGLGGRGPCPEYARLREIVGLQAGESSTDGCAMPADKIKSCDRVELSSTPPFSIELRFKERRNNQFVYTCASNGVPSAGAGLGMRAMTQVDRCGACIADCPTIN